MLILGIDPGTAITGFGVVDYRGNSFSMVECGCIRTQAGLPLAERLQKLYRGLLDTIKQYNPAHVAVEELFFNNNVRTALAVGHARGVILLAAAEAGVPVFEYTPLQVKQAVAGFGRAAKAQVQYMVKTILCLPSVPGPDDVADALAVAICHAHLYEWERKFK
ncbi:Crossover junction endodeoxyribonuclease RuvC [Pelotomaculum sp. FP]|uniref:crossover junction endodeoxyribonuclease RuvC n=1 Tax=Pelotomaculum sp. FP TaxID=261474 RepID=UPI0010665A28|nr:crossover junction endodeoxyribonuclease RuvC [Pelotomaculum sp. FP]TEB13068.1 Crossover junction endodeoxyribonuclease RuvC [Pelotomaculum sp. FP]